jgi:hypothetical protein
MGVDIAWVTGDRLIIECGGRIMPGEVLLASSNSVSLMLKFDGILADHVGMMPVLRYADGIYRSVVTQQAVTLHKPQ